jgi:hypothetical protein
VDGYDSGCVYLAIENGVAAAKILHSNENIHNISNEQVRIAFDGDAVLFSEESELVYKNHGLDAFIEHEKENKNNPLEMGPFADGARESRIPGRKRCTTRLCRQRILTGTLPETGSPQGYCGKSG